MDNLTQNSLSDSTERKCAEEALQESEKRYRILAENVIDVIWTMDMNLRYTFVSPSVERLRGYSVEEMMNQTMEEVLTPASYEVAKKVFAEGQITEQTEERSPYSSRALELELRRKDGSTVWTETKVNFLCTPDGQLVGILGVTRDITERRQAEEQLRTTLESIGDGFFACDGDWRFVYVNAQAERILGIRREEVLGKNHWEIFPPTMGTSLEREYRRSATGEIRDFESFYEPWGRWFHNRCFPRKGGGMSVYFKDITERKRAEKALRESEERLHVLSSHLLTAQETEQKRISMELHDELGQALIALKLRLRSIQKMLLKNQKVLRNECEYIQGSIEHIIENVRRLSQGLSPYLLENLGLSGALRRLIDDINNDHKIETSLDIAEIDKSISKKRQLILYRIFQETLANVRRHAQATRISVVIKRETDHLSFSVEDNGKGFDLKQAMMSDVNVAKRGLGLAAMGERVRMLGGVLDIQSKIGRGTKISFVIPVGKEGT